MTARTIQTIELTDFLNGMPPHLDGGMPTTSDGGAPRVVRAGGFPFRGPVSFLWFTTEYVARFEGDAGPALGGGD